MRLLDYKRRSVYEYCVYVLRLISVCFFFQAEDGIRDLVRSRGLGDVYKRQVNKRTLLEKVAELVNEKKIEGISNIQDESDKSGMLSLIHI